MHLRPRPLPPFLQYRLQYTNTLPSLHRLKGGRDLDCVRLARASDRGCRQWLALVCAVHSYLGLRVIVEDHVSVFAVLHVAQGAGVA